MSANLDTIKSSYDAVVSTEPPSNSDAAISDEVKVAVGDDFLESNAGTLTMDGNTVVHDSVNDARVSEDERGIVVENVEKILEEKETEVNDEEKEGEYKVSDLVWAKVRNYPWWPGQIFDPSSATDVARKHSNKKGFLIAYFGDQSFAWNEKSKIKPFRKNFSKMQKQSDSPKFLHAVDCAIDEALRRTEFGLSCSCLSKEVFDKIKSQTFVNAGIKKEDSQIHGGDNFSTVSTFKPAYIVQSVQDLAREHFDGFNKLQVLSLKTQLFSYYRWKGYHQFSTQYFLDGLDNKLEDNSEIPSIAKPDSLDEKVSSKKRKVKDKKVIKDVKPDSPDEKVLSKKRKVKDAKPDSSEEKVLSKKRKSKDKKTVNDAKPPSVSGKVSSKKKSNVSEKDAKPASETVSEKVSKKRKFDDSESVNLKKHKQARNGDTIPKKKEKKLIKEDGKSRNGIPDKKSPIPTPKKLFGVGASICRIAKQLSVSPLISKKEKESESQFQNSKESNSIDEFRVEQSPESTKSETSDSSKEKLASLIPNKESKSQFQRSKESNFNNEKHVDQTQESTKSETKSETSDSSNEKLAALIPNKESESESQFQRSKESNSINENRVDQTEESTKSEASDSSKEKLAALVPNKESESESQFQRSKDSNSNHVDQTEESTKSETKSVTSDTSKEEKLTALILKFTNLDSIPSMTELNEIFRGYGNLMESETEVLKKSNCAKLVFEEKSNAESAFSSAGKFSIFGPSLISYRLDYSPTPKKIYTRKGKKKSEVDTA